MNIVNTERLSDAEMVSTFPATAVEACDSLGADDAARSYTSKALDLEPMGMLAPLLVAAIVGLVGFVSVLAMVL